MALAISAFAPWAVMPLLMLGGLYLCFEGVEKLVHKWLGHGDEPGADVAPSAMHTVASDLAAFEAQKIKGAVRTDFVLSAEIIVIALGPVAGKLFAVQLAVLAGVSLLMTAGVYGLVAGIVKLDDAGLCLQQRPSTLAQGVGKALLLAAPRLMKALAVIGTAAMFLVGGGILTHGLPFLHHATAALVDAAGFFGQGVGLFLDIAVGIIAGLAVLCSRRLTSCALRRGP
jgi:predicted DNA repair protein MutK